jgi:outer membrane protein assembly factor BamD (BamD/ComL family)
MSASTGTGDRIRFFGDIVLFGGALLVLLDILATIFSDHASEPPATIVLHFVPVGGGLLICVAVSALLRALAAVVDRLPPKGQALNDLIDKVDLSLGQIRVSVDQVPAELHERLKADAAAARDRGAGANAGGGTTAAGHGGGFGNAAGGVFGGGVFGGGALGGGGAVGFGANGSAEPFAGDHVGRSLEKIAALLEELRDMEMLDDAGKTARRAEFRQRRKAELLADADRRIVIREWLKADRLIAQVEAEFPGDPAIAEVRARYDQARQNVQAEAFDPVRAKVEDLMALGNFEHALATASEFSEKFPMNPDGRALVTRVLRERDLLEESTSQVLFDDMKADIERRNWRLALAAAQRLLEKFPNNRRAEKVRSQLRTIQDNAEIEERQEQESKFQELVRAKRFAEAIELAEDVLDRFPNSPQADSLSLLLPKMRELAIQREVEA